MAEATTKAINWSEQLLRTLLFAPGNHPRKLARVATFGADAIILDLEDAVAIGQKEIARDAVRAALPSYLETVTIVRINGLATDWWAADLTAVVGPNLDAIVLPKTETPDDLQRVAAWLDDLEAQRGLAHGAIRLFPLIETAAAVARVEEIARNAPERVVTLLFGAADFTADLGIDLTGDATEILYARSRVVVAARAARLAAPIDSPYLLDLHDEAGLLADTHRSRQLGFQGRAVIYPPHVATVNQVFSSVSPEELARAQKFVEAFEAAEASGSASIQVDGKFVDYPIYRRALRTLRLQQPVDR